MKVGLLNRDMFGTIEPLVIPSLELTAPENRPGPKRIQKSISTIHFRCELLVSGNSISFTTWNFWICNLTLIFLVEAGKTDTYPSAFNWLRCSPLKNPWEWYIYLHEWVIFMVNVGKYTSPMDHLGRGIPCGLSYPGYATFGPKNRRSLRTSSRRPLRCRAASRTNSSLQGNSSQELIGAWWMVLVTNMWCLGLPTCHQT